MKKYMIAWVSFISFVCAEESTLDSYHREGYQVIDEVQREFVQRVCKKYNLTLEENRGCFANKIEMLGGYFETKKILGIEELRRLELTLIKEYQDTINQNTKIRKFLTEYPFSADRLDIGVFLYENHKKPSLNEIELVFSYRGKLIYYLVDEEDTSIYDRRQIEEKIEDACAKSGIQIPHIRSGYSHYSYSNGSAKIKDS